jgi:hypothetical protein
MGRSKKSRERGFIKYFMIPPKEALINNIWNYSNVNVVLTKIIKHEKIGTILISWIFLRPRE